MRDTRIMLASGTLFDIVDPEGSAFSLTDIAHGLGRVCRFAGHTNRFYSVAEHCCHVARLVPMQYGRAALLHDASEAFIGDVTRPLKALLPDYQVIEARIEDAIYLRFMGVPKGIVMGGGVGAAIKRADLAMCLAEARELMPHADGYWSNLPVDPADWDRARQVRLNCDRPEYATAAWLRAWHRYGHWLDPHEAERAAA
jgi:uncharacterized protein